MFSRIIDDKISLNLSIPQYSEELFKLTDRNREYLGVWLPWLERVKEEKDTRQFLLEKLDEFSKGKSLHACIFYESAIVGVVGYNSLDLYNRIGCIGYWLGQEFNGKGIMTECVRDIISVGREFYNLQRIEIRCAKENVKSRAIPKRLNFEEEGVLKKNEKVGEKWYDHVVYAMFLNQ